MRTACMGGGGEILVALEMLHRFGLSDVLSLSKIPACARATCTMLA